MINVYVSCSWDSPTELQKTKSALKTESFSVTSNGKTEVYDDTKIQKADFVVFVFDKYSWCWALDKLSSGVLKELVWCLNNRKPIFIMYQSCSNGLQAYAAEITSDLIIQGVKGTSPNMGTISIIASSAIPVIDGWKEDSTRFDHSTNFY